MDIIEKALSYVKAFFENEFSGHDYFHTLRVFRLATHIAMAEKADLKIVQLAALLHDVDDRKLSPETCERKENARRFLAENQVDDITAEKIITIIGEISFAGKDSVVPSTLEGKCAQDADRLDAIGAIGIGRAFAFGGNHNRLMHHPDIGPSMDMTKEEYYKHESTTINHFHEKLFLLKDLMNTPTAKKLATARHAFMEAFVAEFMDEWDGAK